MANCDEFIYYDDLVREKSEEQTRKRKGPRRRGGRGGTGKRPPRMRTANRKPSIS